MNYAIIYWSRYGNNRTIAEHLAKALGKKGGVTVMTADKADPNSLPLADVYIFSAAAEKFSIQADMKKLMKNLRNMEGRKYAIINTHALGFKNWLGRMDKLLSKSGMAKAAEIDFRMGDGTDKGSGLPEGWEKRLDEFAGII
jgi:flavodoxin